MFEGDAPYMKEFINEYVEQNIAANPSMTEDE